MRNLNEAMHSSKYVVKGQDTHYTNVSVKYMTKSKPGGEFQLGSLLDISQLPQSTCRLHGAGYPTFK